MKNFAPKFTILLIVTTVCLNITCNGQYTKWQKNIEINNIQFEKLRYSLSGTDTTNIIGFVKNDTEIAGFPCKAGWVHFTKEWDPTLLCLSAATTVHNLKLVPNSWILLHPEKEYFSVVFPKDTTVQGYPCKGGGGSKGARTGFYKSGKLRSFFATRDVQIDDVDCKGSIFHSVQLHENGKLKSAKLAKDLNFKGETIKNGTIIHLDDQGNMLSEK